MKQFKPARVESLYDDEDIVIGTIKTLEEKYGIFYLVKAFKIINDKYPMKPLKLLIVGGGSLSEELKNLVENLGIKDKVIFTGKVPFLSTPRYQNMLSISVCVSINDGESFGVSVLEASSCAKPVIVSDVGGLPEVVENGKTGIVVPPKDELATAFAIERLILNEQLQVDMGRNGRKRVEKLYNWHENVLTMINIYTSVRNLEKCV